MSNLFSRKSHRLFGRDGSATRTSLNFETLEDRRVLALITPLPNFGTDVGDSPSYSTANVNLAVSETDTYVLDLKAGDVLAGISDDSQRKVELWSDYTGQDEMLVSGEGITLSKLPAESPFSVLNPQSPFLPESPQISYVIPYDGTYEIRVENGTASNSVYDLKLAVSRPSTEIDQKAQVIYLDFDGASGVDRTTYDGKPGIYDIPPLSESLANFNHLDASDEEEVINAIVAVVRENMLQDIVDSGINATDFHIEITDSRSSSYNATVDTADSVSVVYVGGVSHIFAAGINGIGQAKQIDFGNFDLSDDAIVTLDKLSSDLYKDYDLFNDTNSENPEETNRTFSAYALNYLEFSSLNGEDSDRENMIRLLSTAVGNIISHEAGHLLGLDHTTLGIMGSRLIPFTVQTEGNGDETLVFDQTEDVDFGTHLFSGSQAAVREGKQDAIATLANILTTDTGPRVFDVKFESSLSGNTHNGSLDAGTDKQLSSIPIAGLDTFTIDFKESVDTSSSSLKITDANTGIDYIANLGTSAGTTVGWVLPAGTLPTTGQFVLELSGITAGGKALDGEWINPDSFAPNSTFPSTVNNDQDNDLISVFPSGDGVAGGAFEYRFTLLPDVDRNNAVDASELALVGINWDPTGTNGPYGYEDGNFVADGNIDASDLAVVGTNWSPTGKYLTWPAPAASAQSSSTNAVVPNLAASSVILNTQPNEHSKTRVSELEKFGKRRVEARQQLVTNYHGSPEKLIAIGSYRYHQLNTSIKPFSQHDSDPEAQADAFDSVFEELGEDFRSYRRLDHFI